MTRRLGHRRRPLAVRVGDRERGAVLMVVALSMTIVVTCTALTIDLGRVSTLRRDLQNVADAAALDLARALDGETVAADLVASPLWQDAVQATLDRNAFVPGDVRSVEVAVGTYDAGDEVFTAYAVDGGPDPFPFDVPSAVRVRVTDRVDYAFAPGGSTTSRQAVATTSTPVAGIQVGSYAARLDSTDPSLLNALLGPLGGTVALDLVGYQGLAGGSVRLGDLVDELDLSAGTPDQLLATEVGLADLLTAQAGALRRGGDDLRAQILEDLVVQLPDDDVPVRLGELVDVGTGGMEAALAASIDALELLTATAFVADGDSALSVPGLSLGVGGVVVTSTSLQVIESPRWGFGPVGTDVETAQVRLAVNLALTVPGLSAVTLAVVVEAAPSRATIAGIACGAAQGLEVDVATSLLRSSVDFEARINLLLLGPVDIASSALVSQDPTAASVSIPLPEELGQPVSVPAPDLNLSDVALPTPTAVAAGVNLGGALNLILPLLNPLVAQVLGAVDGLAEPLLDMLGISAPGADVTALGIACGGLELVA